MTASFVDRTVALSIGLVFMAFAVLGFLDAHRNRADWKPAVFFASICSVSSIGLFIAAWRAFSL